MKRTIPRSLVILALTPVLFAAPPDVKNPARTYIPDEALQAPVFTPPAPVVPKPLPNIRIDASITLENEDSTTLTLQRGAASTLPDLPPPPPPEAAAPPHEFTAEDRARFTYERRHNLNLGATIYDHRVSQIQWTDQETGTTYQATCGFDISLLAGIGGLVHDGENYSLFLMHSCADTKDLDPPEAAPFLKIPAGAIRITTGNANDPEATAPLYFIKDLLDSEKERLTIYQAAREKYHHEAAAWAAAHPPVPHDETIIFRPHRGSRYLTNPQPENKGATTR